MYNGLRLLCAIGLLSWQSPAGAACAIADQSQILDESAGLYLAYSVTGFQDKVEIYSLYRRKPTFDECGSANEEPASSAVYDPSQGFLRGLRISDGSLDIVYTRSAAQAVDHAKVRLPRP